MQREDQRTLLWGSERTPVPQARLIGKTPDTDTLTVSVVLFPQTTIPKLRAPNGRHGDTDRSDEARRRTQILTRYGASETSIAKIYAFAQDHGLIVVEGSNLSRTIKLHGTVEQMEQAFHVDLYDYEQASDKYRGRTGGIYLPSSLAPLVSGVFGLDNRAFAKPYPPWTDSSAGYEPNPTGRIRGETFPKHTASGALDGSRLTIAILAFHSHEHGRQVGSALQTSQVARHYSGRSIFGPKVRTVFADGSIGDPCAETDANRATHRDICVARTVAPSAQIDVYFALNTCAGWLAALDAVFRDAAHPASVISNSWCVPEDPAFRTGQLRGELDRHFQMADQLGITLWCRCRDWGARDTTPSRSYRVGYSISASEDAGY